MLDTTLPSDPEAEATAIGCALAYPETLEDFVKLTKWDFYDQHHRAIFEGIQALYRERGQVEPLRLNQWLLKHKGIDASKAISYQEKVLSPKSMETAIETLRKYTYLRTVKWAGLRFCQEADKAEDADVERLLEKVAGFIDIVSTAEAQEPEPLGQILDRRLKAYISGKFVKGVPTGLTDLDRVWGGFLPGELTVLAARPSMGKTAFAQYLAVAVAEQTGQAVLIFSLEMARDYLGDRYLAEIVGTNIDDLRRGYVSKDRLRDAEDVVREKGKLPVYIDDSSYLTTFDIQARARKLKRKTGGLGLIVVDFLTLLADTRSSGDSRHHQVDEATRKLRAIAKELSVPVLVLAQLNREVEKRQNKRPVLSDLRESGGIEEAADSVLFLYRDEYYNPDTHDKNTVEVHIAKQKQGPRGVVVKLFFDAAQGKFGDLAMRDVPEEWRRNAGN